MGISLTSFIGRGNSSIAGRKNKDAQYRAIAREIANATNNISDKLSILAEMETPTEQAAMLQNAAQIYDNITTPMETVSLGSRIKPTAEELRGQLETLLGDMKNSANFGEKNINYKNLVAATAKTDDGFWDWVKMQKSAQRA